MTYGIKRTGLLSHALRMTGKDLAQFGKTLVIVPHPDDESLACGGMITLLRELGNEVECIFISDGSMSHPMSVEYPAEKLAELRKNEALSALAALDVESTNAIFLNYPDGSVPNESSSDYDDAVKTLSQQLLLSQPDTVFVPFRLDPHRDHQASWQLMQQALTVFKTSPRIFEYPVWLWELGHEDDYPGASEMTTWSLDIGSVLQTKRRAIAAHQSQLGMVIQDDPTGFVLTPHLLSHFEHPFEIFFESR